MFVVVRTRATDGVDRRTVDTLRMLRLTRPNHCTVVPDDKVHRGMLQRTKDWIAWGEVDEAVLARLLESRGRLTGDRRLSDTYVKKAVGLATIRDLARDIAHGKLKMTDVPELKALFRLNPPKGGYGGNKRGWNDGGGLGYRGKEINKLVTAMLAFEETAAQGGHAPAHHIEAPGAHHPVKHAGVEGSGGAQAPQSRPSSPGGKVK